jgi:predicted nucleotidyltransferase
MVAEIVEQKKDEIAELCRSHRVRALWLFGSAVTNEWDNENSDLDFLVDLGAYSEGYASRFFSLRRELACLTSKSVDLASVNGMGGEDDWFRREVEATRVLIYDARRDQLVA